ncbi:type II toxin-antitoxin system VapC family toxin [Synechococcus sp. CBW1107]|uniref:type II toxin-antitoxin system VapC family toxin n=1 Tax=Synechococcus sp. CBW1107 TaxID=2789857 RepID=UPI002AD47A32|nr:type II toxin-antitoxin system VapC family toxin [Synechococcus sp. CBW1107]
MIHTLVVDTSALMALLLQEPEAEELLDLAARAERVQLSAATRLELTLVAEGSRFNSTSSEIEALLNNLRVQVLPFDANHLHWALHGWRHYGRGRHKAALNLGDCFSYGLAKALDAPLLFKGEDFQDTDVKVAR